VALDSDQIFKHIGFLIKEVQKNQYKCRYQYKYDSV